MELWDAYSRAIDEDDDPKERIQVSTSVEIKRCMVEEIVESLTEIRDNKTTLRTANETIEPLFKCVAFWFIIGIRVGKLLRDEELAVK